MLDVVEKLVLLGMLVVKGSMQRGEVAWSVCLNWRRGGGGVDCTATLSVLNLNGLFLLQGAQVSLCVCICVCVFYSQVECSQVSVRCQAATCLCVFKAADAWIVFTAQRAEGGRMGEGGEERVPSFDLMKTV